MTVATVIYDATNGSDTAASGSNLPATAKTGVDGDGVTNTLTLNETVDFTGVADDGTDVLYYEGATTDRHLFTIASFNPSVAACTTITTTEAFSASRTAKKWAVGGKRKTLENDSGRYDHADWGAGWVIEFEVGTYTITNALTPPGGTRTTGPTTLRAVSGAATRPVLDVASNIYVVSSGDMGTGESLVIKGLDINSTATSLAALRCGSVDDSDIYLIDCEFDTVDIGVLLEASATGNGIQIVGCTFTSSADSAIEAAAGADDWRVQIVNCKFIDITTGNTAAILAHDPDTTQWLVFGCTFSNCDRGVSCEVDNGTSASVIIRQNTIYGSDEGVLIWHAGGTFPDGMQIDCSGNIFHTCDYGFYVNDTQFANKIIGPNAFYNSTSGDRGNVADHDDNIDSTLTENPFEDPASADFDLNNAVNGGELVKFTCPHVVNG
ncbi:MAG: hypothetical protein GY701_28790 [Sulfitobacter sp.]|nr:hypothetical protein [Sulfitobacter sp.]